MITKTDFVAFLDAPRHLWAIKHNLLSEKALNVFIKHLFEQGYNVEKYAVEYIKNILIPQYGIKEKDVILQPTEVHGDFQARTDALIKNTKTGKYDMYEIKSTTDVKKQHKYDATFQYLVFKEKYEISKINILHLNKDYVRKGDLNLLELFKISDITDEVYSLCDEVKILRKQALAAANCSNFETLDKCIKPKDCPCIKICHANLPEYSIYDINYFSRSEEKVKSLIEQGIESVFDIPNNFKLSEMQRFQVDVARGGKLVINKEKIREDIKTAIYPLHFIDYESYNPAIPMYDGYKPFDQMPFQWSLHVQQEPDSKLIHYEFIETEKTDPIRNFLTSLKNYIQPTGSLIVWNKSFEGTQNKRMGEIHPDFNDFCLNMNSRIYDLMEIFRKQWYGDVKLKGSFSIKNVLPQLAPELSYKDLEIGEGATAMTSWNDMVYGISDDKERVKNNLLRYCELDTLAMVKIFERLKFI